MSSTSVDKLSPAEISQLSLSYAAFILADAGAKVNAQTLQSVLDAAGLKTEKLWVDLFAKTLANKPVDTFFSAGGSSSAAPAAAPAAPAAEKGGKKEEKKEEKKPAAKKEAPPPEPEDDMDMGGLFE